MTEEEARAFLRLYTWTFQMRKLAGDVWNVYAYNRHTGRQVHLCPLSRLDEQTPESLLAKLNDGEK